MVFNAAVFTMCACMFMAVFMLMFNDDVNSSLILYLDATTQHPKSVTRIGSNETEGLWSIF